MRTAVAETSIAAYHALGQKLGRQQQIIVAHLSKHCHRDWTRGELAHATGMRLSSVCGRIAELMALHIIIEGARRPCATTNVNSHPVSLAPMQLDMF